MNIFPGTTVFGEDNEEFMVGDPLGSGSFGYVYRATRKSDHNLFALKTIPFGFSSQDQETAFRHEGELAIGIDHPHVIRYQFFHDGSLHRELPSYIIMEYANGGTLHDFIEARREQKEFFDNRTLLKAFRQMISGMTAINAKLVHRDIKPDNILLHDGALKITDFGLSKVAEQRTRTSTLKGLGNIGYTAPEGWRGDKNTIQMDIYSMGILFYELSTLVHPFTVSSPPLEIEEWKDAHLFTEPDDPRKINRKLPEEIVITILRMMEKKTTERCKNWDEVEKLLFSGELIHDSGNPDVDDVLNVLIEKDARKKQAEAQRQETAQRRDEFIRLVNYQFKKEIIEPLGRYVSEINHKYGKNRFQLREVKTNASISKTMAITVDMDGQSVLEAKLQALFEFKIVRESVLNDYGRPATIRTEQIPMLKGNVIKAWGKVTNNKRIGFNLLLIESSDPVYGEWVVMMNRNNALSRNQRLPEPFAHEFKELPDEIETLNAIHIYTHSIEQLSIELIAELMKQSL